MNFDSKCPQGRVAAVGMFDGVHLGHAFVVRQLCSEARDRGLKPLVVTFARHPLHSLRPDAAPRMLCPLQERTELLKEEGDVEILVLDFDEIRALSAEEFLGMLHERYNVNLLLMGFNNHIGSDRRSATNLGLRCAGVEIVMLPPRPGRAGISSSEARAALAEGRVADARNILGRPYSITGTVVEGRKLGRTIGFPTANISPDAPDCVLPAGGVYAVDVRIGSDAPRRGMLNIGTCPTVQGTTMSIEVHILDFEGDLYGQHIAVDFLERLREEQNFGSLAELRRRLELDRDAARNITIL